MSDNGGSWWPFAVPAIAAAALVTTVFLVEGGGAKNTSLTCPASIRTHAGVPAVPSVRDAVDKNGHMAPVRLPTDAVTCSYASAHLAGSKQLAGPFENLVDTVAYLPRSLGSKQTCSIKSGARPGARDYLLGLTYTDGTEWIAATDNLCAPTPTTNGSYHSPALLATDLRAAYRSGAWPKIAAHHDCAANGLGRSGQETALVPTGAVTVDICKRSGATQLGHAHITAAAAGHLTDALNGLATTPAPTTGGCFGWNGAGQAVDYLLVFHYSLGADSVVDVETDKACAQVSNRSLAARDVPSAVRLVEDALGTH